MPELESLFAQNQAWSDKIRSQDPTFFEKLSKQQSPEFLWIGCADSRVPANEIVDLLPGELFVHRNVANVVVHADLNALSVIQFAVDVLKVKHIMVVGHYGCGGVRAALRGDRHGLVDNWLRHVQDVRDKHQKSLDGLAPRGEPAQVDRLCELNAIEQALNVAQTTVVRDAWDRGQKLKVHAWVYGLKDGLVSDLKMSADSTAVLDETYHRALASLAARP